MSQIPKPSHPIVDGKLIDRYWYDALQRLADRSVTETRVVEIVQAQTPPPAASATTITPTAGIDVAGNAADGYYIGLRALPDTGVGAALWKFTRDDYGRVSGTESATTDDLPEGATNLYHTDERAQDAVGAAIAAGTGDGVTLSYDDAGNKINATNTDKGSVAVASHVAAADPHPQYTTAAEAAAAAPVQSVNGQTGAVVLAFPPSVPLYVSGVLVIPANTQVLWTLPIEFGPGAELVLDGEFVEVV